MNNFFLTALKSLKQTGTVTPSSKFLIRKITNNIDFQEHQTIVEFGMGDGCVTEILVEKIKPNTHLHGFELNDEFFEFCEKKFENYQHVNIYQENALDFEKAMNLTSEKSVDYFVSGLPLSLLKNKDIDTLVERMKYQLKPNGKYVQFQYSTDKLSYLKKHFGQVKLSYVLRNFPPAFVYSCQV